MDLNTLLTGADSGGTWTNGTAPVSLPITGSNVTFPSCGVEGTYNFDYTVTNPCGTDVATVTVNYDVGKTASNMSSRTQCQVCGTVQPVNITCGIKRTCDNLASNQPIPCQIIRVSDSTVVHTFNYPANTLTYTTTISTTLTTGVYQFKFTDCVGTVTKNFNIIAGTNLCAGTDKTTSVALAGSYDLNNYRGTGVVTSVVNCWSIISSTGTLGGSCGVTGNNILTGATVGTHTFQYQVSAGDSPCVDTAVITLIISAT